MTPTPREILGSLAYGPAPESAGPALEWLATHRGEFGHHIGGNFAPSRSGATFPTRNPASGEQLAMIADGDSEDVDAAVAAASSALSAWQGLGSHARAKHLYALGRLVQRHSRIFAVLESLDNGKPFRESRDLDIPLAARHFVHHAGWAQLLDTEFPGLIPLGVVGAIIPWNFPLLMLAWKVAPALAAGNTVVLKPAEDTPLSALLFAELAAAAGLPPGVLNVVTGGGAAGAALAEHAAVAKVAFTGSTEVGRAIRRATAGTGKRLTLELGGKSAFIVFPDADLDAAVEGLVDSIWLNQGQVCCAGSRLLVQEGIAEAMERALRRRMASLRIGDPLDKAVDIGAIISPGQLARIHTLVDRSVAEGASRWSPEAALPAQGCWFPPTLLTNVAPTSTAAQVEIFGPVLSMLTFRTPDEAVALANNSEYGLAASVWSSNLGTAIDVARRVDAGTVWVNSANLFDAAAPFGGYHASGFGRESGRDGMREQLQPAPRGALRLAGASGSLPPPASAGVDRTVKLYIAGKQARPDGGLSERIPSASGGGTLDVPLGNRKDVRNAVEAARGATGWPAMSGHGRAQVLYFLAENVAARASDFAQAEAKAGSDPSNVERVLARLFSAAAWCDKFAGQIAGAPLRGVVLAAKEPMGVLGIRAHPRASLADILVPAAFAAAMGNRVVVAAEPVAGWAVAELIQVLETSDVPAGAINLITGPSQVLAEVLADHEDVDALWDFGETGARGIDTRSAGNLKRVWRPAGFDPVDPFGDTELLQEGTQVKTIWLPAMA